MLEKLPIVNLTPFTFLDYPDHTACIVWFGGCNMRCSYCHNPELVRPPKGRIPFARLDEFLRMRQGKLEGVVLSGGEASLSPQLVAFCRYVKAMGFKLKLDTNGTRPDQIRSLLAESLVDVFAIDYKAPAALYQTLTRRQDFYAFSDSLDLLVESGRLLEVRTTYHSDLLTPSALRAIQADLLRRGYRGVHAVQAFRQGHTLMPLRDSAGLPPVSAYARDGIIQVQRGPSAGA